MRVIIALLSLSLILLPCLQAEENLRPPSMGPSSDGGNSPPAGGANGGTRLTPPKTVAGSSSTPTTQPTLQPTVVATGNGNTNNGIMVDPKPTPPKVADAADAKPADGNKLPAGGGNLATGGSQGGAGATGGNVQANFKVFDLALGASQEIEIGSNADGTGNYQFPSGQGVVSLQIGKDGSLSLTGVSGQVDLQCQTQPLPIAGTMNENQQLKITGVTKFIAKKVDNRMFISLRLSPDTITISYTDLTPPTQTTPKENYTFRFLMVGYPPILIANGKTIQLVQSRDGLVKKSENNFANVMSVEIYKQGENTILITGGTLLGLQASP